MSQKPSLGHVLSEYTVYGLWHTWAKVKPYVVKCEFQNSLMYRYSVPPIPKPKIGLLLAHVWFVGSISHSFGENLGHTYIRTYYIHYIHTYIHIHTCQIYVYELSRLYIKSFFFFKNNIIWDLTVCYHSGEYATKKIASIPLILVSTKKRKKASRKRRPEIFVKLFDSSLTFRCF